MTLSRRILVVLLPVVGLAIALVVFLLLRAYEKDQRQALEQNAYEMAGHYAGEVSGWFAFEMTRAQTLASQMEGYVYLGDAVKDSLIAHGLRRAMGEDSLLLSAYAEFAWGLYFQGQVDDVRHRSLEAHAENGEVLMEFVDDPEFDTSDVEGNGYYLLPVGQNRSVVTDPYRWKYDWSTDSLLEITIGVPIRRQDKAVGVLGFDVLASSLQAILTQVRPYGKGFGVGFFPQAGNGFRGRPYKNDTRVNNGLRKAGVFGQESVTGVNRVRLSYLSGGNNGIYI